MVRSKGFIVMGALALVLAGVTSGCTAKIDPADMARIEAATNRAEAAANKAEMAAKTAADAAQRADAAATKAEAIMGKAFYKK
jgi:hypothetical protein